MEMWQYKGNSKGFFIPDSNPLLLKLRALPTVALPNELKKYKHICILICHINWQLEYQLYKNLPHSQLSIPFCSGEFVKLLLQSKGCFTYTF